jgi:hypothetical protein
MAAKVSRDIVNKSASFTEASPAKIRVGTAPMARNAFPNRRSRRLEIFIF